MCCIQDDCLTETDTRYCLGFFFQTDTRLQNRYSFAKQILVCALQPTALHHGTQIQGIRVQEVNHRDAKKLKNVDWPKAPNFNKAKKKEKELDADIGMLRN